MAVSIRSVAKEANVSVSAASKALNNYPDVAPETKKRILDTAKRMGYVPNRSARMLASKNIKDVAILLPISQDEQSDDDVCFDLIKGASRYTFEHGMNVATYVINSEMQKKKRLADFCHEYSLLGVLLFGFKVNDAYINDAQYSQIPCVGVDLKLAGEKTASVRVDDRKAFQKITEYVIGQNHRKLVLVYGRRESEVANERYKGFCDALEKHHININDIPVIYSDFLEEKAWLETRKFLLQYGKDKGTAFICMSDKIAMGVYRAISDSHFSVPEDFSVTGFDGLDFLKFVKPRLTTVNQQFIEKGYAAIQLLERLVNGDKNLNEVLLPYEIAYGESVRKLI